MRARAYTHTHTHTHTHKIAMSGKSQFSQLQNQYDHISMLVGTLVVFLDMHVDLDLFSVSTVNLIEFFFSSLILMAYRLLLAINFKLQLCTMIRMHLTVVGPPNPLIKGEGVGPLL